MGRRFCTASSLGLRCAAAALVPAAAAAAAAAFVTADTIMPFRDGDDGAAAAAAPDDGGIFGLRHWAVRDGGGMSPTVAMAASLYAAWLLLFWSATRRRFCRPLPTVIGVPAARPFAASVVAIDALGCHRQLLVCIFVGKSYEK
jgi:hypothetical protein